MIEFEFSALFVLAALLATGSLASTLCRALPLVRVIRAQFATTSEVRELGYTITETVARWNDGTVVALPVRMRSHRPRLSNGLRAAA